MGELGGVGRAMGALPASSARTQKPDASTIARLQQRIDELEAKLQARAEHQQDQQTVFGDANVLEKSEGAVTLENQEPPQFEVMPNIETDDMNIAIGGDGSDWLG